MKQCFSLKDKTPFDPFEIHDKQIRAVLFDLDGTLLDTMPSFASLAADILHEHAGLDFDDAYSQYLATSGIPFLSQLHQIVPGHPQTSFMNQSFEDAKCEISADIKMSDDTIRTLEAIAHSGIGIAISSNNNHEFVRKFSTLSPVRFDFALGYTGGLRKGLPHLAYATRHYSCATQDLLFVGDSLNDAALAVACNVSFIAVTRTMSSDKFSIYNQHTVCIPELSHLLTLLPLGGTD